MYKETMDKYRKALEINPAIAVTKENVRTHIGCSKEELSNLGLEKKDLLRLSRLGLAVKGYAQHEKTKSYHVRWIILKEAS